MKKNIPKGKEVRKPVAQNFAPKRLAINFDPPMLIMEYLVIDSGKLYHHKMRLSSILVKPNVTREDVLNYVKTKHYLYFMNGRVSDQQLYKFIDKILLREGKLSKEKAKGLSYQQAPLAYQANNKVSDDFDYLNDQEQEEEYYEEDYQDFQIPVHNYGGSSTLQKEKPPQGKNTFLTYCQEYEDENEGQASWDLDMDQNADYV